MPSLPPPPAPPPAPADSAGRSPLPLPASLGKYPVQGILGRGAMGVVYKAVDPVIQRPVAIKTVRRELLQEEERGDKYAARFRQEARAAGRLNHPGIVSVYEYGEAADCAYIAMEYVEGHTLREYFLQRRRFTLPDTVSLMAQLLDALQHAHERGVWHRDVKPGNLIVMRSGRLKVSDFGIARIEASAMTQAVGQMGTPGYMAPEQYGMGTVDQRADLFAAGVVFYQLLTGEAPFAGATGEVVYKVCHSDPVPPSQRIETGLACFDPVVAHALAKSPGARFSSAAEFRAALLAAHAEPPNHAIAEETVIREPLRPRLSAHGDASSAIFPALTRGQASRMAAGSTSDRLHRPLRSTLPPGSGQPGAGRTIPGTWPSATGTGTWSASTLKEIVAVLTRFQGPLAKVLVRRASTEAADLAGLLDILAGQLEEGERRRFRRQVEHLTVMHESTRGLAIDEEATVPVAPDPAGPARAVTVESIAAATAALAQYMGPIASVMVRRAQRPGISLAQFHSRLGDLLPDPAERERFLRGLRQGKSAEP